MTEKKRFLEIDTLRGIAIFVMILVHTNYYFLSDKVALTLWNYSELAVPVFIFCSSFIFFQKEQTYSFHNFISYIKKRLLRLLIPYYIFLAFFLPIIYWKEPAKITFDYVLKNIFVIGGVDINWLVLLFLLFSFIMPFIAYAYNKQKILFYSFVFVSFLSSVLIVFIHPKLDYRVTMWLPWSLVAIYSFYLIKFLDRKWFFPLVLFISGTLWLIFQLVLTNMHQSLYFHDNKYPPNIYHLSFGIFAITVLFYLASKNFFKPVNSLIHFLSMYSYQIYFIHYIILYVVATNFFPATHFNWVSFFLTVFSLTMVLQLLIHFTKTRRMLQ